MLTYQNGCKISESIFVDNRVPERRDSPPVLLKKYLWSPRLGEVWIWVNTLFFHSCQRAKITRAPCRRRIGGAVPCAEKFGDLITADNREFSLKIVNLEAIIDLQSWYRTWLPNGSSRIRAKQTLPGNTEELAKFLEPNWKPKVIHTENSLEFGKACEDLSWNHCTSTPHRSETYGISERAVRRVKEGTSAVLLQRVQMKVGGQIKWNVTPIFETSQICCLMGRRPMKDVLGNHLRTDYSIWIIGWVSPYDCEGSVPNPSNLERKFYLDCSSDTLCTLGEFGRVTYWWQTLWSWRRWTHRTST